MEKEMVIRTHPLDYHDATQILILLKQQKNPTSCHILTSFRSNGQFSQNELWW